mgnify:CR=1 FL=1
MNTSINVTNKNLVSIETVPEIIAALEIMNRPLPPMQKQALLILGPVGVGKTQIPVQVANDKGWHVVTVNLTNYLPSEVTGWTTQVGNEMAQLKPRWFTEVEAAASAGKTVVVIFEEFCQCDQDVQSSARAICLDRMVAGCSLPDNCLIIANGNRKEDKANAKRLPEQVASGFTIIEIGAELEATLSYFEKTDVSREVITYLTYFPATLHDVGEQDGTPRPTPRSWEATSNIVKGNFSPLVESALIAGRVGVQAAAAFVGFKKMFSKLISPAKVLEDPSGVSIPEELDVQHAMVGSVVAFATSKQGDALATWIKRLPRELQTVAMQTIKRRNEVTPEKKITSSKLTDILIDQASLLHGDD